MTIVTDIIASATEVIGKFIPDADKRLEAELELARIADGAQSRYDERLSGQIEVNKIEAANPNLFVSGWRPFIGWSGGVVMTWTFLGAPIVHSIWPASPLPAIDSNTVMDLIWGLLGIGGGLRTIEKLGGVATAQAPKPTTVTDNVVVRTVDKWFKKK